MRKLNLRTQRGSAMTEFVILLPIWITMFLGIINLGKMGMTSTAVHLTAQKNLWTDVIAASSSDLDAYMVPATAGADEFGSDNLDPLNVTENPMQTIDNIELVVHGGSLVAAGHWGESYGRVVAFSLIPFLDTPDDLTVDPGDILGEKSEHEFPHALLNDSIADQVTEFANSDSIDIGTIISSIVGASGFTQSLLAGIRYGVVFSNETRSDTLLSSFSYDSGSHFDVLVGPKGQTNDLLTFGGAFLLAQTVEEYRVMQRWGDSEWDRGSAAPASTNIDPDAAEQQGRDQGANDAEERCDELEDQLQEGETLPEDC